MKKENKVKALCEELGYEEFVKQLIKFEKEDEYTDKEIDAIYEEFMDVDYYFSILQIQECIDDGNWKERL